MKKNLLLATIFLTFHNIYTSTFPVLRLFSSSFLFLIRLRSESVTSSYHDINAFIYQTNTCRQYFRFSVWDFNFLRFFFTTHVLQFFIQSVSAVYNLDFFPRNNPQSFKNKCCVKIYPWQNWLEKVTCFANYCHTPDTHMYQARIQGVYQGDWSPLIFNIESFDDKLVLIIILPSL